MRALFLALPLSILTLLPSSGNAGDVRNLQTAVSDSEKSQATVPNQEKYRGYLFDLSAIAERKDIAAIADDLRRQIDIIESVGLSPRVLEFFRAIPILVDEFACLNLGADTKSDTRKPVLAIACYGWFAKSERRLVDPIEGAKYTNLGVVMVHSPLLDPHRPTLLHEMLHAYHTHVMPQGVKDKGILFHYKLAKDEQLYPADAYLMTNEKEFFAVTASVFLYGKDGKFTRSNLKEKQPDYFNYLVWLFGFDPDDAPSASPIASAN